MPLVLWVAGDAIGEGSVNAHVIADNGQKPRAVVTHRNSGRLQDWRQAIAAEARNVLSARLDEFVLQGLKGYHEHVMFVGAVSVSIAFRRQRPQAHYMRDGLRLKASAPAFWDCAVTPDIDKLGRAVLDALTSVLWADDKQVAALSLQRWYAGPDVGPAGAVIVIDQLRDGLGAF